MKHGIGIAQRVGVLDFITNIWEGVIRSRDSQELRCDVNRDDVRSGTRQLASEVARATSQLKHCHSGLQMTTEHLHPPLPAKFAGGTLPIPNLPGAVLGQKSSVLNFVFQAVLHLMLRLQINLILPAANPSIRSRIRPCFQRSMLVEP